MIVGQPDPTKPGFPPLLRGEALRPNLDPVTKAVSMAMRGIDPGLVVWSEDTISARAALILAPEEPLETAMGILFAAELGLSDSLGALAPPEVAVHFVWPDRIKVNGALCGHMYAVASTSDPKEEPDWLVLGMEVPIMPVHDAEPGDMPDQTTLAEEGCGEITAPQLIENWARHTMVWISRFIDDGIAPLHAAWRDKCDMLGEEVESPQKGIFMGLDENGGMLLKNQDGTHVFPLTTMLETKK
ncbi:MAG: DUF4444 domain-containing protein [Rhizobiales bacterium]|nr:DUF4444 domain-containing protein [Hyphomicrobiales bacterium]